MNTQRQNPIRVGVLGFGVVGSAFCDILHRQHDRLARRTGLDIQVVAAARRNWPEELPTFAPAKRYSSPLELVEAEDVDVVVELMGGTGLAVEAIKKALTLGKPVITANKAALSICGDELFELAERTATRIGYEASVAGGIPIIQTIVHTLAGDTINEICGILNGTCNYILTKMDEEGLEFEPALRQAQELGYAEADPSADIDGWDTAHKTSILARLAFETPVDVNEMPVRGIRNVNIKDIDAAKELGYKIRLLGTLIARDNTLEALVAPHLISNSSTLALANGPDNAIEIISHNSNKLFLHGPGAGGYPTANSVVNDLIRILLEGNNTISNTGFASTSTRARTLKSSNATRRYIRVDAPNQPGVLAKISQACAQSNINISSIIQHGEKHTADENVSVIITTSNATSENYKNLLQKLEQQFSTSEIIWYPILEEEFVEVTPEEQS